MRSKRNACVASAIAAVILAASAATATTIPVKCQIVKEKLAGVLSICLQKAEAKFVATGDMVARTAAIDKCKTAFSTKWAAVELKATNAGGTCQTTGDETAVKSSVSGNVSCIASALQTGNTTCLLCGNGILDAGEDCDLGTLGGATCSSATGGAEPLGTLACGTGCVFDTSGCGSGAMVGGYSWFLGTDGASCDATCAAQGLIYDPATATYAGSGGTDANCQAVMTALGHPGPVMATSLSIGFGCVYVVTAGMTARDTSPTSASASMPPGNGAYRACACQ